MVGNGLNIREDSKMRTDAISEELKKNQQNFSYNESVFAAKQLRDNENEASYAGKIMPKRSHEAEKTGRLENSQNEIAADDLDKLESGVEIKVEEAVTMSSFMKTDNEKKRDKVIRNAKKAARKYPERPDKQTVELKIDLKVAEDSSPDISSSEARKSLPSLHNIEKDVVREDKTPLRLDGVGGGEEKDEDSLDDLKTLLQLNKTVEDPAKLKVSCYYCFILLLHSSIHFFHFYQTAFLLLYLFHLICLFMSFHFIVFHFILFYLITNIPFYFIIFHIISFRSISFHFILFLSFHCM